MSIQEVTEAQRRFATEVLQGLLHYIRAGKLRGPEPYCVSHAWTEGPTMYLAYKAPPSDITWGLSRDTRQSLIDPGPWLSLDEAVTYYYELGLYEDRMSASFRHPGDPTTILWSSKPGKVDLPQRVSDIPIEYRYTPPVTKDPQTPGNSTPSHVQAPPRRYYDPRQLEQPES
ncbi:hypothetical protein ABW16_13575 [Mycolicibacter heraklionensis]|uniref:DUF4262 domain-containing protein n=1 Tax=Mycolicibacter heraklionensis TaxID=512402 RepID=A0ABR5FEL9_9MYCO|nr:hypothetical protein [Mycolicibacter heraklionensis]KLO28373.1 hypothetical protein ABW16_13575 [Mycolicibacter heraklionensis]